MKPIHTLHKLPRNNWILLLPLATIATLFSAPIASVHADTIRECRDYGVVRDRNDQEALLLPRNSVAACARRYQTLDQTYRVRQNPNSDPENGQSRSEEILPVQPNNSPAPASVPFAPDATSPADFNASRSGMTDR